MRQVELSPDQTGDEVDRVADDGEDDEEREENDPDQVGGVHVVGLLSDHADC